MIKKKKITISNHQAWLLTKLMEGYKLTAQRTTYNDGLTYWGLEPYKLHGIVNNVQITRTIQVHTVCLLRDKKLIIEETINHKWVVTLNPDPTNE